MECKYKSLKASVDVDGVPGDSTGCLGTIQISLQHPAQNQASCFPLFMLNQANQLLPISGI